MKKTLGGDRLGTGSKMQVKLKNFERSTHDLSYLWRSTMAAGTLTPFLREVALPGDTFDIDLNTEVLTQPTIGPLFGSYEVRMDLFQCPIRLYQAQLHNNKLGIGLKMSTVRLPELRLQGRNSKVKADNGVYQINPSSIAAHLGMVGLGHGEDEELSRSFNALPYLMYWDIYKNYYANKQEKIGAVIHSTESDVEVVAMDYALNGTNFATLPMWPNATLPDPKPLVVAGLVINIQTTDEFDLSQISLRFEDGSTAMYEEVFHNIENVSLFEINVSNPRTEYLNKRFEAWQKTDYSQLPPRIVTFPLSNIDDMREDILSKVKQTTAYRVHEFNKAPYNLIQTTDYTTFPLERALEGLGLKTYKSDVNNNWLDTEWISGSTGINEITAIDVSDGKLTMDELIFSRKVYDMLNQIAVSGGSYDDWIDAVYTHDRYTRCESPMFVGGAVRNIVFQEVVSNSASETAGDGSQPLGTLAGRGVMGSKRKGGRIRVKVDEPSYIIGIMSITPIIDYSQGNKWDVNLKTMDDFHKPALDGIGFQDLITDQMDWRDTFLGDVNNPQFRSAGKQPAWINYMTNVNQVRGNFAIEGNEMFMTLNRKYEWDEAALKIKDLTTYIDPSKFNGIFADTRLDAQNFWAHVSVGMEVRRKMSAKIMPNL